MTDTSGEPALRVSRAADQPLVFQWLCSHRVALACTGEAYRAEIVGPEPDMIRVQRTRTIGPSPRERVGLHKSNERR